MSEDFIPLLTKPLREFTPEEFKLYVVGMYFKREPRKATPKKKRQRDLKVSAKVTKKGKLSLTTRREPKYVTDGEIKEITETTGRPENEIFIQLKEKGFNIYADHGEAERIAAEIASIPF